MKKSYTFLIALVLLFNLNAWAQTSPPWDFNNTVEGFVGSNFSSITAGETFATYNIIGTSPNPNLDNTNAMIDTSVGDYLALTIQNTTANTRVQVITNRTTGQAFTNFDGIIANDSNFTTYYINMASNAGWTGILSEITFRFKTGSATSSGDIFFDNIEVVAAPPTTSRVEYTFDDTADAEGFIGANGVTLSQPIVGEIQLDIDDTNAFPKFEQSGAYNIDADFYKGVRITLINNSPKTRLAFVSPSGGNQFASSDIPVQNDNITVQTVEIDLSELTNWSGTQVSWWFQLVENTDTGAIPSAGTMRIQQILFVEEVLGVDDLTLDNEASVAVYPNPVKDILNIQSTLQIEKVEVHNLLGQLQKLKLIDSNAIDTSSLKAGVYMLKIFQENNVVSTKKFIKN